MPLAPIDIVRRKHQLLVTIPQQAIEMRNDLPS
jgi:hypothetical protein